MNTDVTSENYNHAAHFARIYYQQALIEDCKSNAMPEGR